MYSALLAPEYAMSVASVLLSMNDTTLVFLHPEDALVPSPTVVQVTIKSDGPETVDSIAAFYMAQHEVSDLVTRIITAHLHAPIPPLAMFKGNSYTLVAKHAYWRYGLENLHFMWGKENVQACKDKWTFVFKPTSVTFEAGGNISKIPNNHNLR
ncbi:hypothetical protein WOLCODRAFT_167970 [Wolfiporia cocos MD-104 SS10]|uniref:Uncharacterized protein n=1 Tax=Wolfiporia cocos (strain MD-104) TaxID=742152 RepID=A0A2H3JHY5_WOLCO|nr:hypothetical protein WOLCODRAFT_167970 [Wolfiporia cocos MD-104 SS10]